MNDTIEDHSSFLVLFFAASCRNIIEFVKSIVTLHSDVPLFDNRLLERARIATDVMQKSILTDGNKRKDHIRVTIVSNFRSS